MYHPHADSEHNSGQAQGGSSAELYAPAASPNAPSSWISRLQSALLELSTALNETEKNCRSNAASCLQRAQAILKAINAASQPPKCKATGGLAPWQLERVLAHVEANLSETIRNRDLAQVARLSECHFNVSFRITVGRPPHEYVVARRVEQAQWLMLSTDAPLSDIAIECGFADQAHFSRLFRSIAGETPGAWRRARAEPE